MVEDVEFACVVGARAEVCANDVAMICEDDTVVNDVDDDSAFAFQVSAFGWVGL